MDWSQISQNLAALPNNPLFNFGLGMLSTPYQRTPVSFGQVLGNGVDQMNYARQMQAKQQQADMQAKMLQLKYNEAQQTDQANATKRDALSKYAATLSPDEQTLFNADPQAYITAHYKNDASKPIFDAKDGGFVDPKTRAFTPITVGTGVPVPASVPRVGQSAPQSPIAGLPQPVQNYVSNIEGRVGSRPMFDSFGVPSDALIRAQQAVESGGNPNAVSKTGAQGVAQFEPATWRQYGQGSPFDPTAATAAESKYLQTLYRQFGGNPQLALAAYNMGPGAVSRAVASNAVGSPASATPVAPAQPGTPMTLAAYRAAQAQNGGHIATPAEVANLPGVPSGSSVWIGANGEPKIIAKGNGFQGGVAPMPGNPDLSGDAYLASVDPQVRSLAEGLLSGTKPWPTGTVLKNPLWSQAVIAAQHAQPGFNADTYNQRAKARNAFTNGKQGDMFRQLRTIAMHADQYTSDVNALNNGNFTPWNATANAVESAFGAKAPGNVAVDAHALAEETSRFLTGGVPAETTTREWEDSLGKNASHDQQISRVTRLIGIVGGQLSSLVQQYKTAMGPVSEPLGVINPDAAQAFQDLVKTARQAGVKLPAHVAALQDELAIPTPGASVTGQQAQGGAPAVGAVEGGYRFKGGDPSQQSSWVKVQ